MINIVVLNILVTAPNYYQNYRICIVCHDSSCFLFFFVPLCSFSSSFSFLFVLCILLRSSFFFLLLLLLLLLSSPPPPPPSFFFILPSYFSSLFFILPCHATVFLDCVLLLNFPIVLFSSYVFSLWFWGTFAVASLIPKLLC